MKLFIVHFPLTNNVAGSIATAEFFAPVIETSPLKLVPPLIINFSIVPP